MVASCTNELPVLVACLRVLMRQTLSAVDFLHCEGLVHRDFDAKQPSVQASFEVLPTREIIDFARAIKLSDLRASTAKMLCWVGTLEHPWANHDNIQIRLHDIVQIRLHPFPQSIHVPTMITSRSDSIHSRRASMCQPW